MDQAKPADETFGQLVSEFFSGAGSVAVETAALSGLYLFRGARSAARGTGSALGWMAGKVTTGTYSVRAGEALKSAAGVTGKAMGSAASATGTALSSAAGSAGKMAGSATVTAGKALGSAAGSAGRWTADALKPGARLKSAGVWIGGTVGAAGKGAASVACGAGNAVVGSFCCVGSGVRGAAGKFVGLFSRREKIKDVKDVGEFIRRKKSSGKILIKLPVPESVKGDVKTEEGRAAHLQEVLVKAMEDIDPDNLTILDMSDYY